MHHDTLSFENLSRLLIVLYSADCKQRDFLSQSLLLESVLADDIADRTHASEMYTVQWKFPYTLRDSASIKYRGSYTVYLIVNLLTMRYTVYDEMHEKKCMYESGKSKIRRG